ncbi:acetyl esterase [Kushneria sinocarnis]|uniref:Acetyl esterase n=1 Tax=Kushneria sinocarnis TaxID=595502 RepID=A0A420WXF8_9GAMM|nr:alpha/beta hydrolase [Kushneria sinocarnis]RKR04373.1 acetyl esterase [Kushneria sinocarnis]
MSLDSQALRVLECMARMSAHLPSQPTAAQLRLLQHERTRAFAGSPREMAGIEDLTLDGVGIRLYVPHGAADVSPLLIYCHGGGFVTGDLDTHDVACRHLADEGHVRVAAVDYRRAPEHPFPAALEDGLSALRALHRDAAAYGVDPARIIVGGDSAGGSLAAVMAQQLRDRPGPQLAGQLLFYPCTRGDVAADSPSRRQHAEGHGLTLAGMRWYMAAYAADHDPRDVRISPFYDADPGGLPPTFLATAEHDLLRDEGEVFGWRLSRHGVLVTQRCYPGTIHACICMDGVLERGRQMLDDAACWLRTFTH